MNNLTNITEEDYKELHEQLAKVLIDFFKEKKLPENAWKFDFTFDDLKSSVDAGTWVPYSDSGISLWDHKKNCLYFRM